MASSRLAGSKSMVPVTRMLMGGLPSRISAGATTARLARMAAMSQPLATTDRTKVRRLPDRGTDDRTTAYEVIDEAYIAHVGFVVDGEPRVLPMTYGRDGDVLYLHGAVGQRHAARVGRRPRCASPSRCSTGSCSPAPRSTTR